MAPNFCRDLWYRFLSKKYDVQDLSMTPLPSKLRPSLVLGESLSCRDLWYRFLSKKYDVQDLSMTPRPSKLRLSLVIGESLSSRYLWHCHGKCDSEHASAWPPIFEVCSPI
jgi:hypothetical protein